MAPNKRHRSTKEVGLSSQALPRPQRASRMSTNAHARYNCLNERVVVATRYYDEDLLARLGMLDNIRWLFTRGGMSQISNLKSIHIGT